VTTGFLALFFCFDVLSCCIWSALHWQRSRQQAVLQHM
jgi:hypothetical protein